MKEHCPSLVGMIDFAKQRFYPRRGTRCTNHYLHQRCNVWL